ncbi:hypothetical protein EV122DRAFT_282135 [Schizophyllum commune]
MPTTSYAGTTSDPLAKVYITFVPRLQRLVACGLDVEKLEKCYRELSEKSSRFDTTFRDAFLVQMKACTPFLGIMTFTILHMGTSDAHLDHPARKMLGETIISDIDTLRQEYKGHNWHTVDDPQSLFINLRVEWENLHKQLQSLCDLLRQEYGESAPRIESLTVVKELLEQCRVQLVSAATTGADMLTKEAEREGWATGSS